MSVWFLLTTRAPGPGRRWAPQQAALTRWWSSTDSASSPSLQGATTATFQVRIFFSKILPEPAAQLVLFFSRALCARMCAIAIALACPHPRTDGRASPTGKNASRQSAPFSDTIFQCETPPSPRKSVSSWHRQWHISTKESKDVACAEPNSPPHGRGMSLVRAGHSACSMRSAPKSERHGVHRKLHVGVAVRRVVA